MSVTAPVPAFEDRDILPLLLRIPSFEEALARMLYVVEQRRPCGMVVGARGTGKSALLRAVAGELARPDCLGVRCVPVLIELGAVGGANLSWAIAAEMGLSPTDAGADEPRWRRIEDRFQGACLAERPIVPILDHPEPADHGAVADITRLCHMAARFCGTVLLSARSPLLPAMVQAVGPFCDLRIELPVWTPEETASFVRAALDLAELRPTEDVPATIHAYAGGRTRDVLQILRLAVYAASHQQRTTIDGDLLQTIAPEVWRPPAAIKSNPRPLPPTVELAVSR